MLLFDGAKVYEKTDSKKFLQRIGYFIKRKSNLRSCPRLGFVEHGDVATDFQFVAVEPDGTLIGLAVLGIVDSATFPLILFLSKTRKDIGA